MTYSTEQVSAYARVTLRQLQYWDQTKIICPFVKRGWGNARHYTPEQATEALVIGAFLRKGLTMWWVRENLNALRKIFKNGVRQNNVIIWDGTKLHYLHVVDATSMLTVWEHAQAACTLVRIPKLINKVEK
jgi:DNA-binding transcriptional MerR regulator